MQMSSTNLIKVFLAVTEAGRAQPSIMRSSYSIIQLPHKLQWVCCSALEASWLCRVRTF